MVYRSNVGITTLFTPVHLLMTCTTLPLCQVLGLGTHYADYMSKTDAYLNYLLNSTGPHTRSDCTTVHTPTDTSPTPNTASHNASSTVATPVPEDDVVIFMDAYDVLVFPSIVKAASVLAQSRSPIVFCAERGVYPEFAGGCCVYCLRLHVHILALAHMNFSHTQVPILMLLQPFDLFKLVYAFLFFYLHCAQVLSSTTAALPTRTTPPTPPLRTPTPRAK